MGKTNLKRLCLELIQHFLAVCALIAVAGLLINSFIKVDSIDGTKTYKLIPFDKQGEFEESEIYRDLFRNAVSDITQLVVIRGQLETDGRFDPTKKINITEFAGNIGKDDGCAVSAVYDLDDLIKWGRAGVEYQNFYMSMSQFVNYFGYAIYPENFHFDEYGQLCFDGFYRVGENTLATGELLLGENGEPVEGTEPAYYGKSAEEVSAVWSNMQEAALGQEQLEDMAFAYIMGQNLHDIEVSREDNNNLKIRVPIINCRYATTDGDTTLMGLANNWVDYLRLQNNLAVTIETVKTNYQRYLLCNKAYSAENSNVKYVVRMMAGDGIHTYTNMPDLAEVSDGEVTEMISEFRRYLIYYPDNLVFMGNTILSEEEIFSYINNYAYAYPDTTHIWLGVDTTYPVKGDAFSKAYDLYEKTMPKAWRSLVVLGVFILLWLSIGIYLSVTAGVVYDEHHNRQLRLKRFDYVWTEVLALIAAGFGYGAYRAFGKLQSIAQLSDMSQGQVVTFAYPKLYQYGSFALFGLYLSMATGLVFFSFVRRAKADRLWEGSLLHGIGRIFAKFIRFILTHKNSAVSSLVPYNLYLFSNLFGVFMIYQFRTQKWICLLIAVGLVVFNGIIGSYLFKQHAEQNMIIDGINRIRDGEVELVLDSENLHGNNRELADAVNNIGEGIRKAVKTSMKDEQMKTDLITNVSHDIKTPLTSIINYVDLLKRLKIQEEPAKSYIEILDTKAQRLKQLTDDLVEASKISSGNITLNLEKLNLTELINQGIGEFLEKLEERGLQVIFESGDLPAYIYADSRRMWRVLENLLNNISKYAMENTRVYFDLEKQNGRVIASVKNISKQQMNIRPDELTERFIRGDSARSTEGSGLGLSIAKSLTQVQGGEFTIYLDGDLFKVTLDFAEYQEQEIPKELPAGETDPEEG